MKLNNKWIKIIIINILLFIIEFSIIEILHFKTYQKNYETLIELQSSLSKDVEKAKDLLAVKYYKTVPFNYKKVKRTFRNKIYRGDKKGSIVLLGCSYTEGVGLEDEQTFAYKLNKLTGRTTYNRGVGGTGPGLVYRQLSDNNFENEVGVPDYIIYTFLFHHIYRQFATFIGPFSGFIDITYYIDDNNDFKEVKHPFYPFYSLFTVKHYLNTESEMAYRTEKEMDFPLFKRTMLECVKVIKSKFPNTKFVILDFPDKLTKEMNDAFLPDDEIKYLEDLGIIYIKVEDLIGHEITDEYRLSDKDHPNEKAWDEIVPALVKKLKL